MEPEALLEAIAEFEKKPNKEVTPELDGFMRHVAKTGETMLPWPQLKGYFMYKLERVLDDFRASVPEVRGPPNRNVDYVPYDDMKERLLKIVDGFTRNSGQAACDVQPCAPFTIQRLCELLMEPKKHYKRTDKFMRGIEKNVLVVSSVYPSSEKFNFSTSTLNRVNGILPSGPNTAYQDRSNVNGPGTPRPPIRSRSPSPGSCPLLPSSNGFGDGTVHHATDEERASQSSPPPSESNPLKTKHGAQDHLEEGTSDDPQAKRLRFDEEDEEEEEDEDQQSADEEEEEEAEERGGARGSSARSPEATSGNARSPHGFEQRPVSDITEEQSCSASADTGATEHCSEVESVPSSVSSEPKVTGEEQEDEEEEEAVHDMDQSDCGGGVGGPEAADSEAGAVAVVAAAAATEAAGGSGGEAAVSSSGLAGGADSNSSDGSGCGGSSSVSSSAEPSEDTEQPMDQD